jgi:hypothetical protein
VTVVVKGSVASGNTSATAVVAGAGAPVVKASHSGPRFPLKPKFCEANTVCVPPGVNAKISPVVAVPGIPISATKRLPAPSKANPRGNFVSPVANRGVISVPSVANLRISPVPSLPFVLDTKRLPDASKARPTGPVGPGKSVGPNENARRSPRICLFLRLYAPISVWPNGRFKFDKRSQLFTGTHNEALPVAVCISNRRLVSDFPVPHAAHYSRLR